MCSLFKAKDMGIDLGTANTLIYVKDTGIILNEPSVIAVENRGGKTLAVGLRAKEMLGKAPQNISVVRPLHMRTICLFYFLLAFSHCIASVMRGAGKATVPMFTMLACWCLFRVTYITIAVKYVNQLTTVSWAYPITWTLSSIIFLIYFLKADWIHNFDRELQKA